MTCNICFFAGSDSLPRSTTSSQVQAVVAGDEVAVRHKPAAHGVLGKFGFDSLSAIVCAHVNV